MYNVTFYLSSVWNSGSFDFRPRHSVARSHWSPNLTSFAVTQENTELSLTSSHHWPGFCNLRSLVNYKTNSDPQPSDKRENGENEDGPFPPRPPLLHLPCGCRVSNLHTLSSFPIFSSKNLM